MKYFWMTLFLFFQLGIVMAQEPKNVFVPDCGQLRAQFTEEEAATITHLAVSGKLNAIDFRALRDEFKNLRQLDLTNAEVRMYVGKKGTYPGGKQYVYPLNCIPAYAFCGHKQLEQVILPTKLLNIEDAAFKDCDRLQVVQLKKKKPVNLLNGALNDSLVTVFVPLGCRDAYWRKEKWQNFNILEGDPVSVSVTLPEPGTLTAEVRKSGYRLDQVNVLTVEGSLDLNDFKEIRDNMPNLVSIDLSRTDNGRIPAFTFSQKRYLMFVKLPETMSGIEQRAFSGCIHLTGVLKLPASVQNIAEDAFLGCTRLERVQVGE